MSLWFDQLWKTFNKILNTVSLSLTADLVQCWALRTCLENCTLYALWKWHTYLPKIKEIVGVLNLPLHRCPFAEDSSSHFEGLNFPNCTLLPQAATERGHIHHCESHGKCWCLIGVEFVPHTMIDCGKTWCTYENVEWIRILKALKILCHYLQAHYIPAALHLLDLLRLRLYPYLYMALHKSITKTIK